MSGPPDLVEHGGRRFARLRVTIAGRPFVVVETALGAAGDASWLTTTPRLPVGVVEVRDGRAYLCHALPADCAPADLEAVLATMARTAAALAAARDAAGHAAFAHYAR